MGGSFEVALPAAVLHSPLTTPRIATKADARGDSRESEATPQGGPQSSSYRVCLGLCVSDACNLIGSCQDAPAPPTLIHQLPIISPRWHEAAVHHFTKEVSQGDPDD